MSENTKCWQGCRYCPYCQRDCKLTQVLWETIQLYLLEDYFYIHHFQEQTRQYANICSPLTCTSVFSFGTKSLVAAFFITASNLEITQTQTNGSTRKESMVHSHSGTLYGKEQEDYVVRFNTILHTHHLCCILTASLTLPRITQGKSQLRNYLHHTGMFWGDCFDC